MSVIKKYFIFDMDSHMSPYRNFEKSIHADEWEQLMAANEIDRAIAWLLPQGVNDVSESNRYIYENSLKNPRIIPFGWANIREGLDKAKKDARKCLQEYKFKGVKLNGAQNEYSIDSPEALEVISVIAELKGMVAFHIGADSPDYTNPLRAEVVARRFPETVIFMTHMGGAGIPDMSEEVIEVARRNPNMYLIGSAIGIDKVKKAIDTLGSKRVLFGSDAPFYSVAESKKNYLEMLSGYDEQTIENVLGLNAKRLFQI